MKVAIIGNGLSRELFNEDDGYDKVIGCNLPPKDIKFDHAVCVDSKAVMLAYRRTDGQGYDRLERGEFTLVIGPRCAHGIKACKADPASEDSVYQDLTEKKFIHKEIGLWADAAAIKQRYFSAGHLAFAYVNNEWADTEIHIFGFDSLFTGNQSSYSDQLRNKAVTKIKRGRHKYNKDRPVNTVGEWYGVWELILKSNRNRAKKIVIHGYDGDDINDFFKQYMEIQHHEKLLRRE